MHTGDVWNGGTGATVFVTLHGERGDSGVREFYRRDASPDLGKGAVSTQQARTSFPTDTVLVCSTAGVRVNLSKALLCFYTANLPKHRRVCSHQALSRLCG